MRTAILTILLLAATGCGGDEPSAVKARGAEPSVAPGTCRVSPFDAKRAPASLPGIYWGQEIWISYRSEEHVGKGFRYPRTRAEALAKARDLCRQVHAGADLGKLARRWSNGDFGLADGLCVVPEPSHRNAPDARDVTLFRTPIGSLTPLLEWRGGFWFARRLSEADGRKLDGKLQKALKLRARARVIHIHHAGAFPRRFEFDNYTKAQAVEKAWAIIRELEHKDGKRFAELARKHSNEKGTRERDGLLTTRDPITKKKTEWIRWGDRNFSQMLLDVILEKGTPGRVWPEPVISGQGVDIVLVLERRSD